MQISKIYVFGALKNRYTTFKLWDIDMSISKILYSQQIFMLL